MNFAQERHLDEIDAAAAELMRRVRAAALGKKRLVAAVEAIRKAVNDAKAVVVAEE